MDSENISKNKADEILMNIFLVTVFCVDNIKSNNISPLLQISISVDFYSLALIFFSHLFVGIFDPIEKSLSIFLFFMMNEIITYDFGQKLKW